MSKAQKFAIQRNSKGGLLKGIVKNLNSMDKVLTDSERKEFDKAKKIFQKIEKDWSNNYQQAKEENL